MKNMLIFVFLLSSLLLSVCQSANPGIQLVPSTTMDNTPVVDVLASTTLSTSSPQICQSVTPLNTYVTAWNEDGTANYEKRVCGLAADDIHPDISDFQPGSVILSEHVRAAISENDADSILWIAVSYAPMVGAPLSATCEDVSGFAQLRQQIIDRFTKANYYTSDTESNAKHCSFYLLISVEQLKELHCGDDLMLYIYVPRWSW